ncbi:MAG: sodium:solute symporter [Gammaproteobacteria bacterium]|nr:MAG: sodium:solute symporter [Gammaproteobacteria bacterium]
MSLTALDLLVIALYLLSSVGLGLWIARGAGANIRQYFLGGNRMPWYVLGVSNASGMFDISGTMWMVYLLFLYGLKSVYIPWLWPVFNQIFLMVYLSLWLRRSGVMTGAEWIRFRFGDDAGARLAHLVVVAFALLNVLGFLAYGFVGAGKFAAAFLPWQLSEDPQRNAQYWGLIVTALTTAYVVKGGMVSVVATEVLQFLLMTVACIAVAAIAMARVEPAQIAAATPAGWSSLAIDWRLDLDWSGLLPAAAERIAADGWELFGVFVAMMLFKGILQSMAGPAPNYDMQRILAARSPVEAAKMSAFVNVVLLFPRYLLVAGLTVLALVHFGDVLRAMGPNLDFEQILPLALRHFVPAGLQGLLIAGLLAAYMSTFAATTNAAPAYVVNDVYRRYWRSEADPAHYVRLSRWVSLAFVVVGTAFGLFVPTLNRIILWLVAALYGGYVAANVLKWHWWRMNGYGYFYGMLAGLVAAVPLAVVDLSPLWAFPFVLLLCTVAAVVGSLCTRPQDMEQLVRFYLRTRPWGWWRPVHEAAAREHPGLVPNRDLPRDAFNVAVGIVWQTAITASAIYLVLEDGLRFGVCLAVFGLATVILKFTWYDRLRDWPDAHAQAQPPLSSRSET